MRTPPKRLFLALALVALGALACGNVFTAGAAVVNGQRITQEDLDARILAAGQGQAADDALRRQALQQLIEEALLREAAAARGLSVPEEQVEQQFTQIKAQFPADDQFQEALEQRGFTEETLREAIRDQLMRDLLTGELAGEISEADLQEIYRTEQERFTEVRARHILLRVEDPAADAEVRERAQDLLGQLRDGTDFGRLARQESEDTGSAQQGGDLGFFSLGDLVPEFAQAASGAEIGELVGPVRTQFGYHIIEVLERRAQPFEEVREQLRAQLEQQLGQGALNDFLDEALEDAVIRINPRYGEWDAQTRQIVPREPFVPASPAPDPLERPITDLAPPGG